MTEQEWVACDDPDLLLEHVEGKVTREQLVDFVRRCWERITPDLQSVPPEQSVVEEYAALAKRLSDHDAVLYASEAILKAARWAASVKDEQKLQAALLRQVVGSPFSPRVAGGPGPDIKWKR